MRPCSGQCELIARNRLAVIRQRTRLYCVGKELDEGIQVVGGEQGIWVSCINMDFAGVNARKFSVEDGESPPRILVSFANMLRNESLNFEIPWVVVLLIDKDEVGQVTQDVGPARRTVIGCSIEPKTVAWEGATGSQREDPFIVLMRILEGGNGSRAGRHTERM